MKKTATEVQSNKKSNFVVANTNVYLFEGIVIYAQDLEQVKEYIPKEFAVANGMDISGIKELATDQFIVIKNKQVDMDLTSGSKIKNIVVEDAHLTFNGHYSTYDEATKYLY